MTDTAKLPIKQVAAQPAAPAKTRGTFTALRQEFDRLMDEIDNGFWASPFRRDLFALAPQWLRAPAFSALPAVDISEKKDAFEIVAELPGLDEKNVEVSIANGGLTIKGEKQEDKEEKKKDYHLQERHFGSFERSFAIPDGVDRAKIEAVFKKGVLTVTLPKTAEAMQSEKKITVKAA